MLQQNYKKKKCFLSVVIILYIIEKEKKIKLKIGKLHIKCD